MNLDDFATSPAKRRRTSSPEPTLAPAQVAASSDKAPSTPGVDVVKQQEVTVSDNSAVEGPAEECGILDALMQHVESESKPEIAAAARPELLNDTANDSSRAEPLQKENKSGVPNSFVPQSTVEADDVVQKVVETQEEYQEVPSELKVPAGALADEVPPVAEVQEDQPIVDGQGGAPAEWEMDSSPLNSSDSDSSDSDSSDLSSNDSDDDADEDYAMLNPEEQARILMQEDGGSDDDGGKSKDKGDTAPLRTANEKVEEVIPKPDIVVTEQMAVEELGKVEGVVENTVLVKAKTSGEYQVLESGSLLCLKDRSVVGVVAETLGRVELPMYTIRFTNDKAAEEAGLQKDTTIYYVPSHSTFVFTMPLRAVKGSDASNFHDEEVGYDEMEFSDDEAEAEHKRMMKANRRGKREDLGGRGRGARGSRCNFRGDRQFVPNGDRGCQNDAAYGNGSLEMNYDDMDGVDDGYTPLSRPTNFQELAGQGPSAEPRTSTSFRGNLGQPRGRGQGRGNYRGDRGGGGGRGRGGGIWERSSNGSDRRQSYTDGFSNPSTNQASPSTPSTPNQMLPPSHHYYQYPYQQPHQPVLSAQNPSYPNFPFSPSPISPLPNQTFNFGGYSQPQQHHPPAQGSLNPAFMQNFNQAAAAEVQRQLEQMKQNGRR